MPAPCRCNAYKFPHRFAEKCRGFEAEVRAELRAEFRRQPHDSERRELAASWKAERSER